MKTGEIIFMVMVIAMCTVPIWWLVNAGTKRKRVMLKALTKLSKQKMAALTYDLWSNRLIAMDMNNNLFYLCTNQEDKIIIQHSVNLADIIKCSVFTETAGGTKKHPVTKIIGLELINGNNKNGNITISFYDNENDDALELGFCTQLSKKWELLISQRTKIKIAA